MGFYYVYRVHFYCLKRLCTGIYKAIYDDVQFVILVYI